MELRENTYIDISAHAYSIIVDETRTTSRAKLIFSSLLMRLFRANGVEIPQDISLMSTPPAINALTIARIKVRIPGDEEEGDQTQVEPMDTKIEAEGQPLSSRHCDSDESCDEEGNFSAFMTIAPVESSDDLSVLVEEHGEHTKLESMGIIEESDDEEDERIVRLQETYNSLLEKTGKYAKVAKATIKKKKRVEQDY
ncbi:hypothetical protein SO802_015175 [Lithocarpus litseifolius]|uniref:Uncharacterized protein n=1 Tax=Lithocarpus litseifolius TaxID=425828 RepID=A0AAW2CTL4_9ROSI